MKKDFVGIFNKDISKGIINNIVIDEYELDNLLDKNIEIKESELPSVLVDKNDDINKYIKVLNSENKDNKRDNEKDSEKEEYNLNQSIENETKEIENIINKDNENNQSDENIANENNSIEDLEDSVSLKESDLIDIDEIEEDFNLNDALFSDKKNDNNEEIYKNNSEKFNMDNLNNSVIKENLDNSNKSEETKSEDKLEENFKNFNKDNEFLKDIEEGVNYLDNNKIDNNEIVSLEKEEFNNEELNNIDKEFEKTEYDDTKEIDLIEEDNLKKEDEILEYKDEEVIVPSVDNIDYIDESGYINEINSDDEIIELSGNELDLITKDKNMDDADYPIVEKKNILEENIIKENIIELPSDNMRKDNFLLEKQAEQTNKSNDIDDTNKEEEEQKKTDYYINKYKKLHEDYLKTIQENIKEDIQYQKIENNIEANKVEEPKEELIEELKKNETENIESITKEIEDIEDKTNYYINKYKKLYEDYLKSVQENSKEINKDQKEEVQEQIINKIENKEETLDNFDNSSEITDRLTFEEEEMYRAYLGEDLDLIKEEDNIVETAEENIENIIEEEIPLNLEVTDKLSAEEEEMYKAYLGEDLEDIDKIDKDEEIINENLLKEYKENLLNNVEISGELSAEEENILEDILEKNKNKYYDDSIDEESVILKELNLDEIEEIDENDFNTLENFLLGKEQEEGTELISINNKNKLKNDNQAKSVDSFDSIDDNELLEVKENKMPEEKELYEDEKKNIDLNAEVEEEFSLNKDDSVLINEQFNEKKIEDDKEDFDGEITQMDLDFAEKLFENEDQINGKNEEYSPKHDLLLSESDIGKFRKLFSYFKIIVERLPKEYLNEFSKTEFYDIYSALFRKFGE